MAVLTPSARLAALVGATAMLWLAVSGAADAQGAPPPAPLEYVVKAAYLFKFTPFVDWPPRAFAAATSPFNMCVVGQDPFGAALDEAVRGQSVDQHPVVVRRYAVATAGMDCHLLFAGRSPTQSVAQALKLFQGQPVLTVSDQPGGMIRFVLQNGRVRFDVDAAAAQAGGLTISSKLLALSVSHRRTAS